MSQFTFNISLSVLNHLGRNLYRSFITVLGEAISNSWDADAKNVWIYLDKSKNLLLIKDDGIGMTSTDFQDKFLKIGYSKRKAGENKTQSGRPFIGRKGIGKLALLSCADRISIITKTEKTDYVGGTIDNRGLDLAITNDLTPQEYELGDTQVEKFSRFTTGHSNGTIIFFDNIKDGIKNTEEYLKKVLALYFRFSLIDSAFNIHFNGELITIDHLNELADKTQFVWTLNNFSDPFVNIKLLPNSNLKQSRKISSGLEMSGFIASVNKPSELKIITTDERVSIDLFVNGRLREKDILRHSTSSRLVENYLYGQIHFDILDDENDRFTSSREGIVANDPVFQSFLEEIKTVLGKIIDDWDKWRIANREDGDPENTRISRKERKSKELFNTVVDDYVPPKSSTNKTLIDSWLDVLGEEAQFNLSSYAECFVSENLLRKYIREKSIAITPEVQTEFDKWKKNEEQCKNKANISFDIRDKVDDLHYLSMDYLANLADMHKEHKLTALSRDAIIYKPVRDAMAHTAILTQIAKQSLNTTYENIKARVKTLLNNP